MPCNPDKCPKHMTQRLLNTIYISIYTCVYIYKCMHIYMYVYVFEVMFLREQNIRKKLQTNKQ